VAPVECSTRKLNDQKMGKFKSGITPGENGREASKKIVARLLIENRLADWHFVNGVEHMKVRIGSCLTFKH
jgi:hypothetical protein